MTKNVYILDTSVLLSAGIKPLYAYPNSHIIIPLIVIKELEKHRSHERLGFNARAILREIEKYRIQHGEELSTHIPLPNNASFHIEINHTSPDDLPRSLQDNKNDTIILAVARNILAETRLENPDNTVTLITNDLPLRLLAQTVIKINTAPYHETQGKQGSYTGIHQVTLNEETITALHAQPHQPLKNHPELHQHLTQQNLHNANILLEITNTTNPQHKTVTQLTNQILHTPPFPPNQETYGITPRSLPQKVALNYLLNPEITAVSLGGQAGTGKTLLAVAAAIEQTINTTNPTYKKIVIFRPLYAVGNQNLGYLPGTAEEKMEPWAGAIFDILETLNLDSETRSYTPLNKILEILPITHIRGRTFNNAYIIVDETQNLERDVILSVMSRLGENSKIVFSWDAAQRDNLHISNEDGIVSLINKLAPEKLFAHITLTRSERSQLAEIASRILEE